MMTARFELDAYSLLVKGLEGVNATKPGFKFYLDGEVIAKGAIKYSWSKDVLTVDLPHRLFDGRAHQFTIAYSSRDGEKALTFDHQSDYRAQINGVDGNVFGWIYDTTRPALPIDLDIYLDGKKVAVNRAEHENVYAPSENQTCGFGFDLPITPGDSRLYTLKVCVVGTDYMPFGEYLVNIKALHFSNSFSDVSSDLGKASALEAMARDVVLTASRNRQLYRPPANFPTSWKFSGAHYADDQASAIDVIIPVYRGIKETMACITSVLNAKVNTKYRLIVINDFSPEARLTKALRRHSAKYKYQLLENPENLGFVKTVNLGMSLNNSNDVVLLNADTLVSDGWLDRLADGAYREDKIGSVSALSNNATICSLPFIGGKDELPYGMGLSEINDFCWRYNRGVSVDLPTAHGFCMYIRRKCLQEVGLFDAELFGKGYGEENEFSLRSARRGWRHVAACDVFVYHKGSVSFRENADIFIQKNLQVIASEYPDYEASVYRFLHNDPMAPVRNRLQIALWMDRPCIVLISLAVGGGVDTHVNSLAERLASEGYGVLIAKRCKEENYTYCIEEFGGQARLLYTQNAGLASLCTDILTLNPVFIHLHHTIDFDDGVDKFLKSANIPYYVTLHDYFYICPRVTLIDSTNQYCHVPDARSCNVCLRRGGAHPFLDKSYERLASDIASWRTQWLGLLEKARGVFAPSDATAEIYRNVFSDLQISVRPHGGPAAPDLRQTKVEAPSKIRVAILGALGEHKGSGRLLNILSWSERNAEDIEFVLIGYSDKHDELRSYDNFEDMGPYTPQTLAEKIEEANCHVALFLSVWPETYVYTLSEALEFGLTPVGLDLGAVGSRLRALNCGELVPEHASPSVVVDAIRSAATVKIEPGSFSEGRYQNFIEDYYTHQATSSDAADCVMLPFSEGVYTDGWAQEEIQLFFAGRKTVNHLQIELLNHPFIGAQYVTVRVNGDKYDVIAIPKSADPQRLDIITKPLSGLIRVGLTFTHVSKLPDPDKRMASVKLLASSYIADDGKVRVSPTPNPLSVRLVRANDKPIEDFDQVDPSGALEALYNDVANYSLYHREGGPLQSIKSLTSDVIWSARTLRRHGPKVALKRFADMRRLRNSPFDSTFYSMQLNSTDRRGMDPVTHYVVFGAQEGFDPAPGFSSEYYLKAHADVSASKSNPFAHYLRFGRPEERRIEPSGKIAQFFRSLTHDRAKPRPASASPVLSTRETLLKLTYDGPEIARELGVAGLGLSGPSTGFDEDVLRAAAEATTFLQSLNSSDPRSAYQDAVIALNAIGVVSAEKPSVSIIVPVFGELSYTLNCLRSLLKHQTNYSFEIIVADDASTDETPDFLPLVAAIRYVRYDVNEGFISVCNKATKDVRGEYIIILNNDCTICAGWLDQLIATFSYFPKSGIVGSRLFYGDGRLQEAGGIVWRDGSAWNYGRNADPQQPAFGHAREVDYVSGASLCIRKTLWDQLAGFDTLYSPAYYEDTDLAFRVRKLGYQVIMQAQSKVIHYEGKSSGTDLNAGVKAYQQVNKEKFYARWQDSLLGHGENGRHVESERDRYVGRRVLLADACNPTPNRDAGSQATVELIKIYRDLGFQVTFVPEDNFLYQKNEISILQAMGVECLYAPYATGMTQILKEFGANYDVVNLIRPSVAFRNIDLVRQYCPRAKLVYLDADLHYLRMERQAHVENKPELLVQAAEMKEREFSIIKAADVTLVHSTFELDLLAHELPEARVEVLPLVEPVFDTQAPYAARNDVMFLGGYNHHPNHDAALWLTDEIWPVLRQRLPNARLLLVGANATPELMSRANDRVVVTGPVDDLGEWFDQARVFCAPLRYGAGAKGKIIKAMAHGVPVVATDVAVEGLWLEPGKTVFVGNQKDEIIEQVVSAYDLSARIWNRHSLDAQDYIAEHHSHDAGVTILRNVLTQAHKQIAQDTPPGEVMKQNND